MSISPKAKQAAETAGYDEHANAVGFRIFCEGYGAATTAKLREELDSLGVLPAELMNAAMWLHPPLQKKWDKVREQITRICKSVESIRQDFPLAH